MHRTASLLALLVLALLLVACGVLLLGGRSSRAAAPTGPSRERAAGTDAALLRGPGEDSDTAGGEQRSPAPARARSEPLPTRGGHPGVAVLTGRVVDQGGAPVTERALLFSLRWTPVGVDSWSRRLRTAPDGRFRWELDAAWLGPGLPQLDVLALEDRSGARLPALATPPTHLQLERALDPGVIDLGDVVLLEHPVLAAGRLLVPAAYAVTGVRFVLRALETEENGETTRVTIPAAVQIEADGSFWIRGASEAERFTLEPAHPELAGGVSAPFGRGATDLLLRLDLGGTVSGRITGLDPRLPWAQLRLYAALHGRHGRLGDGDRPVFDFEDCPDHAGVTFGWMRVAGVDGSSGAFSIGPVPPGDSCLGVRTNGSETFWIHRIDVPAGLDAADARLIAIEALPPDPGLVELIGADPGDL